MHATSMIVTTCCMLGYMLARPGHILRTRLVILRQAANPRFARVRVTFNLLQSPMKPTLPFLLALTVDTRITSCTKREIPSGMPAITEVYSMYSPDRASDLHRLPESNGSRGVGPVP